jgi:ubiquinone/menaquinone biosynthesis C-methylase UbiE
VTQLLGDQVVQAEVLEGLAMARNHRRWFVELAVPHLGEHPIEIGAGLGDYAAEWLAHVPRMTLAEAQPDRLDALRARFADNPNVDVRRLLLPGDETGEYSAAVAYNVLEHIEDHVGALAGMARLVRSGGVVMIIVPAFPFAMSPVDVATGHVRRYTRASLADAMARAGLTVESVGYANTLGLIGYYTATSLLRMTPRPGPMVGLYDRLVVPVTRWVEERVRTPFGQSVVAVARTS